MFAASTFRVSMSRVCAMGAVAGVWSHLCFGRCTGLECFGVQVENMQRAEGLLHAAIAIWSDNRRRTSSSHMVGLPSSSSSHVVGLPSDRPPALVIGAFRSVFADARNHQNPKRRVGVSLQAIGTVWHPTPCQGVGLNPRVQCLGCNGCEIDGLGQDACGWLHIAVHELGNAEAALRKVGAIVAPQACKCHTVLLAVRSIAWHEARHKWPLAVPDDCDDWR